MGEPGLGKDHGLSVSCLLDEPSQLEQYSTLISNMAAARKSSVPDVNPWCFARNTTEYPEARMTSSTSACAVPVTSDVVPTQNLS